MKEELPGHLFVKNDVVQLEAGRWADVGTGMPEKFESTIRVGSILGWRLTG